MKNIMSLMLLICLAFASFAQSALGPSQDPVQKEITLEMQSDGVDLNVISSMLKHRSGEISLGNMQSIKGTVTPGNLDADLSVSGSPITSSGTISLAVGTIPYTTSGSVLLTLSKKIDNPNLPHVYTYPWNPGYVGWQR